MPYPVQPPLDILPERRLMSAARLFTPNSHGLDEQTMMTGQTPETMRAAWPAKLYPFLVGPCVAIDNEDGRGKQAVIFRSGGIPTKIALAGHERLKFSYNLDALGDRTHIQAKEALDGKYANGDIDAPTRAGLHAVENRLVAMRDYVHVLVGQRVLLQKFTEALHPRHIGLARMGGEEKMREGFAALTGIIIPDMLSALEDQKGWTPHQRELAERTIMARMLADRTDNRHLGYARVLCGMLVSYTQDKHVAFTQKIAVGERYTRKNSL